MLLKCRSYTLDLDSPKVMGVLNVTPDSFSDGGQFINVETALKRALKMVEQGADIIDIGGESTRPGAVEVSEEEEITRVVPLIEALSKQIDVPISIDTSKAAVMYEAVIAGASMINDVNALQGTGALEIATQCVADYDVAICLMHMQGKPRTMQNNPHYEDVVNEVCEFLQKRSEICAQVGIPKRQIVWDPGFGFGKLLEHNLALFNAIPRLLDSPYPLLVGLSRKSMLGQITGKATYERLASSLAVATLSAYMGAHIIRVHDVDETKDVVKIVNALSSVSC